MIQSGLRLQVKHDFWNKIAKIEAKLLIFVNDYLDIFSGSKHFIFSTTQKLDQNLSFNTTTNLLKVKKKYKWKKKSKMKNNN